MNLCGHGTLAAAHTLFHSYSFNSSITFETRSGPLEVSYQEPYYTLQLPSYELNPHSSSETLVKGLGISPKEIYKSNSVIAILYNESELKEIVPQFEELKKVGTRSIIVSAPGKDCDYVLRYFTPSEKNQEDYVTGIAQCSLVSYWSKKLSKNTFTIKQLSQRESEFKAALIGDKVQLSGKAYTYFSGQIYV